MKKQDNEKIKVALIVGKASMGGVINCLLNFYRNVDRSVFQFDFFTYAPSDQDDEIRALGGEVYYFPHLKHPFLAIKKLYGYFSRNDYDIVHANMTTLSVFSLFAAWLAGVKVRVCHSHSSTHPSEKTYVLKQILKLFSTLFATDLAGCSLLANRWLYGKRKGNKAFLLHNAIDLDKFHQDTERRAQIRKALGLEDKQIVGSIGRFAYQKNLPFLIDSFYELTKLNDNAVLVLAGSGDEERKIRKRIETHHIVDKVVFADSSYTPADLYNAFDVIAMPSRYEGLPLVAVEAQACKLPCILSNKITKEVDFGGCEFVSIDSAKLWATRIQTLLNTPPSLDDIDLKKYGYDVKTESKKLENFYKELLK